ncbi:unnamed protein product [Mucor hiemalis]
MKTPQRAIAYLNNTLYNSWSFPDVVNIIKEELNSNPEDSFSVLDRILKDYFKGVPRANEWMAQWKSLIKQFEKTKETRTRTNKSSHTVNINTAKNIFNNYEGTQTICSTFDETASSGGPISTSSTLEVDDQASISDGATKTAVGEKFASLFDDEDEDDSTVKNQEPFRSELFKAVYLHFRGEQDLFLVANLNKLAQGLVPRNLSEALDLLSYYLLNKDMSPNEKNALKLAASHILCFSGPTATVFAHYYDKQSPNIRILFEQAKSHCTHFSTVIGLSEEVKNTMQNLIETTTEELPLRLKITEKKLQLLEGRCHNSEEMQALDVIEYLVLVMRRKEKRHSSELAFYRVTAHIMDIILSNSSLKLVDGENCSQATKSEQKANQKAFCDDFVVFPDGAVSNNILIDNCIIEYKDSIGIVRERGAPSSRKYKSVYMGTYCTVGIPSDVMSKMEESIKDSPFGVTYDGSSFIESEGHRWGIAKILNKPNGDVAVGAQITDSDGQTYIPGEIDIIMAALKSSIKCIASFTFRMKNVDTKQVTSYRSLSTEPNSQGKVHELGITLTHTIMQGKTDLKSPAIAPSVGSKSIKSIMDPAAYNEIMEALQAAKLEDEGDEEEEEEVVEELSMMRRSLMEEKLT